jgi:hypothetical protein
MLGLLNFISTRALMVVKNLVLSPKGDYCAREVAFFCPKLPQLCLTNRLLSKVPHWGTTQIDIDIFPHKIHYKKNLV